MRARSLYFFCFYFTVYTALCTVFEPYVDSLTVLVTLVYCHSDLNNYT